MKLLFVAPDLPYPPRKGYQLMVYHHLRCLAARHTIDLVAFTHAPRATPDLRGLEVWCRRIETIPLPIWRSLLNLGLGAWSWRPWQVNYYRSVAMAKAVNRLLSQTAYDVVVFQLTRMAQYRPVGYHGATILNMVDPFVLNYQQSLRWRPWYTRLGVQSEIARLRNYELGVAPHFERVLLITPADVQDYQAVLPGTKLDWVSHGIDAAAFCPSETISRRPGMIVMTGNMHHAPNVDAAEYFCHEIFPLIRAQAPAAHLWLVGARPVPSIRNLGRMPDITVTGAVPEVKAYLNQAEVSICPVRLNVGTQTKVLEAMAMGTPVVTTSAGNHGVGAVSGEQLYVADTPAEFAQHVVALLRGENWDKLSRNGRHFVLENFTWDKSVTRLERILDEVIAEKQVQPA